MDTTWQAVWQALTDDLADAFDAGHMTQLTLRLGMAAILGGFVGYDRQRRGKEAGLRTHMLVAVGAALFVIIPQQAGMSHGDLSRVIQGIAAGIGFIGGGAILKLSEQGHVKGLTTAAGIWLTAALGVAAGYGRIGSALIAALLGLVILSVLAWYEPELAPPTAEPGDRPGPSTAKDQTPSSTTTPAPPASP